jgi:hypothetical protein
LRRPAKDEHGDVKQGEGNDVFAGDNAPDLRVKGLAQQAEDGEGGEGEHGQSESGEEWHGVTERQNAERNEEEEDSEGNAVGVERKKVGWAEEENCHCGQVEDGWKSQSQVQRTQQQSDNAPERSVDVSPSYIAAGCWPWTDRCVHYS